MYTHKIYCMDWKNLETSTYRENVHCVWHRDMSIEVSRIRNPPLLQVTKILLSTVFKQLKVFFFFL